MYIARHYVRVNGKMFTPGEVITEAIPDNKAGRLLAIGAISKTEAEPALNERGPAPEPTQESGEPEGGKQDADIEEKSEEESDDEDEADEEAEAPEIDVTDGIVAEPEPEEAPAASTRKRSSKKK